MSTQPALVGTIVDWFNTNKRDLPWRAPDRTPWGVLVSEAMLQQTPVARVLPIWTEWLNRWPTPAAFAGASTEDVLRAWGRLGYPRRALNLHRAATVIVADHAGMVPRDEESLRALPGVGEYTAAAVMAFAYGQRSVVLDTNVRRVVARTVTGAEHPQPSLNNTERALAEGLVPEDPAEAAVWSAAVMELGALVCTANNPACDACPVEALCAWRRAGKPAYAGPLRRTQKFVGTDRQVRGRIMSVLREAIGPVDSATLASAWPDGARRDECLHGLLVDGLVDVTPDGLFRLGSQ